MNKILQICLVSAILATNGFAEGNDSGLSETINAGVEVILEENITNLSNNVSNYGTITNGTEGDLTISSDSGPYTITNMITSVGITEVEDSATKDTILAENPGTAATAVHQITYSGGTIDSSIKEGNNVTFATSGDTTIDPSSLAGTDLLYLGGATGSGQTVKIVGGTSSIQLVDINSPFGNQDGTGETTNSYEIETSKYMRINGDISNYKDGKITVTSGTFYLFASTEINSPINVSGGGLYTNGENIDIYDNITVYSGGIFYNSKAGVTLKSGATLIIGKPAENPVV